MYYTRRTMKLLGGGGGWGIGFTPSVCSPVPYVGYYNIIALYFGLIVF